MWESEESIAAEIEQEMSVILGRKKLMLLQCCRGAKQSKKL